MNWSGVCVCVRVCVHMCVCVCASTLETPNHNVFAACRERHGNTAVDVSMLCTETDIQLMAMCKHHSVYV